MSERERERERERDREREGDHETSEIVKVGGSIRGSRCKTRFMGHEFGIALADSS